MDDDCVIDWYGDDELKGLRLIHLKSTSDGLYLPNDLFLFRTYCVENDSDDRIGPSPTDAYGPVEPDIMAGAHMSFQHFQDMCDSGKWDLISESKYTSQDQISDGMDIRDEQSQFWP